MGDCIPAPEGSAESKSVSWSVVCYYSDRKEFPNRRGTTTQAFPFSRANSRPPSQRQGQAATSIQSRVTPRPLVPPENIAGEHVSALRR